MASSVTLTCERLSIEPVCEFYAAAPPEGQICAPRWRLAVVVRRVAPRTRCTTNVEVDVGGNSSYADCHSGNLRRVVVVASTALFDPSALMLNW